MPQGVEHLDAALAPALSDAVRIPLMPQGVEHQLHGTRMHGSE